MKADTIYQMRDFEKAAEQLEKVIARDPSYLFGVWLLGFLYSDMSRHDDAVRLVERTVALSKGALFFKSWAGFAYGRAGLHDEARSILDDLGARQDSEYVSPMWLFGLHLGLGDKERALDALAQAVAERSPFLFMVIQGAAYDSLRSDPRFTELVSQVGSGVVASSYHLAQEE